MTMTQDDALADYNTAIQAARRRLESDLDDATKAADSAMMAACSRFSAAEQAARAKYWQTRHETWLNAPAGAAGGWMPAPDTQRDYVQGELP